MSFRSWFDEYGLLHLNDNPTNLGSENGILFAAEYYALTRELAITETEDKVRAQLAIMSTNPSKGLYRPSGGSQERTISHDNMTGLYCLDYMVNGKITRDLPLISLRNWHPRDVCFYAYAKIAHKKDKLSLVWQNLLLIIPFLSMLVSCIQSYKIRGGNKILKTDGKLLTFLRCKAFKLNKICWVLSTIISWNSYFTSWHKCFKLYFNDHGHPNRVLSTRLGE